MFDDLMKGTFQMTTYTVVTQNTVNNSFCDDLAENEAFVINPQTGGKVLVKYADYYYGDTHKYIVRSGEVNLRTNIDSLLQLVVMILK